MNSFIFYAEVQLIFIFLAKISVFLFPEQRNLQQTGCLRNNKKKQKGTDRVTFRCYYRYICLPYI